MNCLPAHMGIISMFDQVSREKAAGRAAKAASRRRSATAGSKPRRRADRARSARSSCSAAIRTMLKDVAAALARTGPAQEPAPHARADHRRKLLVEGDK